MPEPRSLPKVNAADLYLPAAEQPDGAKIFVRRRMRVRQGRVVGPAQPREIEAIKEQHPEIAQRAGL